MKRVLLICLALAACDTVPPKWAPYPPKRVEIQGSTFDVRQNGQYVFAFRRNSEWAPNLRAIAPKAIAAMEQATGCRVLRQSIRGDAVFITALIKC